MSDNYVLTRAQVTHVKDNGNVVVAPKEGRFKGFAIELTPREGATTGTCLVICVHPTGTAKWP